MSKILPRAAVLGWIFAAFMAVFVAPHAALAQAQLSADLDGSPVQTAAAPKVDVKLVADRDAVVPGQPIKLGVHFTLPKGWHIYFRDAGQIGRPTTVDFTAVPDGAKVSGLLWHKPHTFTDFNTTAYGYENETTIAADVDLTNAKINGNQVTFKAKVTWLMCKDECIPGSADVELTVPVATAANQVNDQLFAGLAPGDSIKPGGSVLDGPLNPDAQSGSSTSVLLSLLFAFIGGLILNLMPCVLPVISMKVLSFVKQAGSEPGKIFKHGLWYTAGTLASFLVLALVVVALRSAGMMVGWGFQFQSPTFLVLLSAVVLTLSLSMLGMFYVNVNAGQGLAKLSYQDGYAGSFFTGILATILATPCSAPFLGTAIGFAFTQPALMVIVTFLFVGLGLAAPYVVLSARPGWLKKIPKPGAWMETFKQIMGFMMLGSVVWLVSITAVQVGAEGIGSVLFFLLLVAFVSYLWTKLPDKDDNKKVHYIGRAAILLAVAAGFMFLIRPVTNAPVQTGSVVTANGPVQFQAFNRAELEKAIADGKTVFIDFTATWCLTCKVNESTAVNTDGVRKTLDKLGAVAIKADWTNNDPEITRLLAQVGRYQVPTYLIFPASDPAKPILLTEVISESQLIAALESAGPSKK